MTESNSQQKEKASQKYKTWQFTYPKKIQNIEEELIKFIIEKRMIHGLIDGCLVKRKEGKVYLYLQVSKTKNYFNNYDFIEKDSLQIWKPQNKGFDNVVATLRKDKRHTYRPCQAFFFSRINKTLRTSDELKEYLKSEREELPKFFEITEEEADQESRNEDNDLENLLFSTQERMKKTEDQQGTSKFTDKISSQAPLAERSLKASEEEKVLKDIYADLAKDNHCSYQKLVEDAILKQDWFKLQVLIRHQAELKNLEATLQALRNNKNEGSEMKSNSGTMFQTEEEDNGDDVMTLKQEQLARRKSIIKESNKIVETGIKPSKKVKSTEEDKKKVKMTSFKKKEKAEINTRPNTQFRAEEEILESLFKYETSSTFTQFQKTSPGWTQKKDDFLKQIVKRHNTLKLKKYIDQGYNPVYILELVNDEKMAIQDVQTLILQQWKSSTDKEFLEFMVAALNGKK